MTTLCVLVVLATPVWLAWCRFDGGPTPDNSLSIEGAISIAHGDGYVRHWFTRGDRILSAPSTRHISEFPPGVSMILLPFVAFGLNGNTVLKSLEIAAILIGGILWVRYLRQQGLSPISQLCLAALIGFNCTPHRIGTTFSDAIVWAAFPAWLSEWRGLASTEAKPYIRSLRIALLTAFLVLIRYQCVALLAVNTWLMLSSGRQRYKFLLLTVALPIVTFGGNLIWNKAQTGATSYITDVAATTTYNLKSLIHPTPVESLVSRPLGLSWFTNRVLESFSIAEQQRKLLRVLIAAMLVGLTFYDAGRTYQNFLKRLNHPPTLAYLATLGLLCVLTIRDTGIRPGWTFIEDERYYLFLYPAFAIETCIAFLSVAHRFESRWRCLIVLFFATTASGMLSIRYCHGVWRDSLQPSSSLYHFLAQEDSLPLRMIVLGNEQDLRALPIEAYPSDNIVFESLLSQAPQFRDNASEKLTALIISEQTDRIDEEDRVADALGLKTYSIGLSGHTLKVFSSIPLEPSYNTNF